MYIVKYSELVHMAEMHSQARASSPYELVPNILRYTFNNLYLFPLLYNLFVFLQHSSDLLDLKGITKLINARRNDTFLIHSFVFVIS